MSVSRASREAAGKRKERPGGERRIFGGGCSGLVGRVGSSHSDCSPPVLLRWVSTR